MRSRNLSGSACILRCVGLKINFPLMHEVHMKFEDCGNFSSLTLCPIELLMFFSSSRCRDGQGDHAKFGMCQHSEKSLCMHIWYEFDVGVVQSRLERGHIFKCLFALSDILCKKNKFFFIFFICFHMNPIFLNITIS